MEAIAVKQTLSDESISGLLCCAFEGGSNYWYGKLEPVLANGLTLADFGEGGKMQGKTYFHWSQLLPLTEGCAVKFKQTGVPEDGGTHGKTYRLDRTAIRKGMAAFAEKYPRHYADFLADNTDAITGDIFLQCCAFGEAIFA